MDKSWAIVTGGGSGLGLSIAKTLAKQGYDIVIVGRNTQKLSDATVQIQKCRENGIQPHVLAFSLDLSEDGAPEKLYEWVANEDIHPDVLVNNAGMYIYDRVLDVNSDRQKNLLGVNVNALASLCRLFGADMARQKELDPAKRKYILNIASYSVYMPIEGFGFYAGSKAFVRTFSKCFAKEMRHAGVKVTAVAPAGMDTALMGLKPGVQKLARDMGFLVNPDRIARISLRAMKTRCITYWIPIWYNVLFIPFLWMFQHIFKKVLKGADGMLGRGSSEC